MQTEEIPQGISDDLRPSTLGESSGQGRPRGCHTDSVPTYLPAHTHPPNTLHTGINGSYPPTSFISPSLRTRAKGLLSRRRAAMVCSDLRASTPTEPIDMTWSVNRDASTPTEHVKTQIHACTTTMHLHANLHHYSSFCMRTLPYLYMRVTSR